MYISPNPNVPVVSVYWPSFLPTVFQSPKRSIDWAVVFEELKFAFVENHLRSQFGKIISFKQALSDGRASHGKQHGQSLSVSRRQKYASLTQCFVHITITRLASHQYKHNDPAINTANPNNRLKAIIMSALAASRGKVNDTQPDQTITASSGQK